MEKYYIEKFNEISKNLIKKFIDCKINNKKKD